MLRRKQAELAQHVQEEQERLARVEARLRQIEQEGRMPTNEVVIRRVDSLQVAAIRDVAPTFGEQGHLWEELGNYLARQHVNPVGPCLTVYHDTESRERDVELEVCEQVTGRPPSEGRVKVHELPAVEKMACILHHGGFERVGETYDTLLKWIETNGYRIVGPNREVYLLAVADTSGGVQYPSEYLTDKDANRLTELQFPVDKA